MLEQIKSTARTGDSVIDWQWEGAFHYIVTLTFQGRQFTTPVHKGSTLPEEPTTLEVLECLFSDMDVEEHDFESWAHETGFDSDGRTAERIYRSNVQQAVLFRKFLGDAFDTIQEEVALATA